MNAKTARREFPFHALKGGDMVMGREVADTRATFGGFEAYDTDGRTILTVTNPATMIAIDN